MYGKKAVENVSQMGQCVGVFLVVGESFNILLGEENIFIL